MSLHLRIPQTVLRRYSSKPPIVDWKIQKMSRPYLKIVILYLILAELAAACSAVWETKYKSLRFISKQVSEFKQTLRSCGVHPESPHGSRINQLASTKYWRGKFLDTLKSQPAHRTQLNTMYKSFAEIRAYTRPCGQAVIMRVISNFSSSDQTIVTTRLSRAPDTIRKLRPFWKTLGELKYYGCNLGV